MHFAISRAIRAAFVPGGVILGIAALLLASGWVPLPPAGVNFFYYAVFVAALLLSWRFHSTRILFAAMVLVLGHYGLFLGSAAHPAPVAQARQAFEAVALLVPLDFILLTFFPERSSERRVLLAFLGLLFFESTFVAVFSRPDQPPFWLLHVSLVSGYRLRLPQPALFVLTIAILLLLVRLIRSQRVTDSGMLWALIAAAIGLTTGGTGRLGTAYFGVAGFILASSIVESSYSLAYRDELTGLDSRRAFNDFLLGLKHPYAMAAVDIDHFKRINDTYGHDTGDHVLRLVASKLARVTGGGKAYRIGGEEFTIIFSGRSAREVADHLELLRMEIESTSFRVRRGEERRKAPRQSDRRAPVRRSKAAARPASMALAVTVSIGVAESQPKSAVHEVVQQADKSLYRAKEAGRNRIEFATDMKANSKMVRMKDRRPGE